MRHEHERWMRLAIEEAELARGSTGDNPWVGCAIVSPRGELLGRGHTLGPGEDHAEIAAALNAHARGLSVVGATLYSTLEPCSFHGRTPACSRSIAERGIALLDEDVRAPATFGFIRPAILIPTDAQEWSGTEMRHAMVHELEHVRRADWIVRLLARVVCALYWFHPFVWVMWRQLCLEAEHACDDAVLRGAERTQYAQQLVELARRLSAHPVRPVLSMASRGDLSARVSAVLDAGRARGRVGMRRAAVIVTTAVVVVTAIAPLRAVAGMVHQSAASTAGESQPHNEKPLAFEVASIKPNKSGDWRVSGGFQPGGRYKVTNYALRSLIAAAYLRPQVNPDFLISGGPNWIDDDRFDVDAKAAEDFPPVPDGPLSPRRVMLQALLADRFRLKVHHDASERSIYALVTEGTGRVAPKLRAVAVNCAATALARARGGPPQPGERPACGMRVGQGNLSGSAVTMTQLTNLLPRFVNRVVVDQTGLIGGFDLDLTWTPAAGEWVAPPVPGGPPLSDDGPSLFTALREQLGLKLKSTKGPVDVLVIDHVEQPTPD
jgi:uncharacterized protein (TIGR03435 family)